MSHATINAAKTHCPRGHAYDDANTYVDPTTGHRRCRRCQTERPSKLAARLRRFGLTIADYEALLEAQGGGCAICGETCKTGMRLAVDHDHETGQIRGLLCKSCNNGLGMFADDVRRLAEAIVYLQINDARPRRGKP